MIISFVLVFIVFFVSIPLWVICFELLISVCQKRASSSEQPSMLSGVKSMILIPAHNESAIIGETLAYLLKQGVLADTIIVIADNCTDSTANIVRDKGIRVIERENQEQRGKGYAIDCGISFFKKKETPEVLIILDADCVINKSAIDLLCTRCVETHKPQQALYLMKKNKDASLKQKVAAFAWLVKNKVRPIAIQKLGLPVTLTGTGMAFPWTVISDINVAHGNIVEDMQLGIDCTLAEAAPQFCEHAIVYSEFPEQLDAEATQRTRWEHGHLATIVKQVPLLCKRAFISRDWKLFILALDIGVPPLALLVLISCVMLSVTGGYALLTGAGYIFYILLTNFLLFSITLMLTWWRYGREYLTLTELASIPFYILSKLSVYTSFIFKRQTDWVRTSRAPKK